MADIIDLDQLNKTFEGFVTTLVEDGKIEGFCTGQRCACVVAPVATKIAAIKINFFIGTGLNDWNNLFL